MTETVEALLTYCRENNRVCPLPSQWNRLWEMLPGHSPNGSGWHPRPPLILAAWHTTPMSLKMLRLREHIEWAASRGSLEAAGKFLRDLREEDWYHVDD